MIKFIAKYVLHYPQIDYFSLLSFLICLLFETGFKFVNSEFDGLQIKIEFRKT